MAAPPVAPNVEAPRPATSEFAVDVRCGLGLTPKRLEPKYLYDDLGSSLFAAICELPWYQVTRAEKALLAAHRAAIVSMVPAPLRLVELGCGTGEKLALLADAYAASARTFDVHLVDVSPLALARTCDMLASAHPCTVVAHQLAYEPGLEEATSDRRAGERLLVLFLGSNLGNMDPPGALEFLARAHASLGGGDHLLLGLDLVKPRADLMLAYDDPLGVTAAFNRNLLVRMNRELDADFAVEAFVHEARWDAAHSRVEMHLVSRFAQSVEIRAAACRVTFAAGESIWTESSYKYEPDQVRTLASLAGFTCQHMWIDQRAGFALTLLAA
jgi:dimethylhistidine N-methyltransferase